ncbi:MAG: phosphoadenylyl-sulfate reductase [Myxococcota bacterium]|nr:phosphoadenylyl-sulfate reductase [Myxococcota bacterium]
MSLSEVLPETRKSLSSETIRLIEDGGLESYPAEKILIWAIGNFHPRLALSASFGAPEGMVLLDMMHRIEPTARVFAIDTGRLPQATHDLIDRVRERYGKPVEILFPETRDLQQLVRDRGVNSFYESLEFRRHCCEIRKVEPMRRHLSTLDAYVTGLRRDQNAARATTRKVLFDGSYGGVVKINPLADWDSNRVWQYVRKHNVPVNRLHRSGYPSVGCEPCSRAIQPGSDPRSGRWWWEQGDTKECGLHDQEQEQGSGI